MSKMLAVRVPDRDYAQLEEVRDPTRYPSQSAFVREAIRRMVQAERRKRILAEVRMLAGNAEEVARAQEYAETGIDDWLDTIEESTERSAG